LAQVEFRGNQAVKGSSTADSVDGLQLGRDLARAVARGGQPFLAARGSV
jgi:hypothetical protein